jgi:hypothetical protein
MSDDQIPPDAEVQEISARLKRGLKACRAMVDDYRLMLGAESNDNLPVAQATAELIEGATSEEASTERQA